MKATQKPPTDVEVTPADLLRMAALYLRRHGWTQGDYYTVVFDALTPRACVSGAIGMAAYGKAIDLPFLADLPERGDYRAAVWTLVDFLFLDSSTDLFGWNDRPGRTAADVINALNAAADRWDRLYNQGGER
ncbi:MULTISPECIES: hypothetical protein [Micromonospora]|uniref:Uncharacterized protein n=1 Tax=Micromonospora aurantiaca (nom. illeg.) TaxID=47850 RepID=A0A6N3JX88_9ACTN|nr:MULTISPECIES: hypothetical protein [Micromonospora]AXH90435.1 hypothetical protein DVH21_11120 [Micromonospora aurantiaca]MBU8858653.1 hypothetical protein [Micromonospora sp. WMMB482]MDM4784297.1 hypothetical protein [Micromonospora sp. b486]